MLMGTSTVGVNSFLIKTLSSSTLPKNRFGKWGGRLRPRSSPPRSRMPTSGSMSYKASRAAFSSAGVNSFAGGWLRFFR